MTDSEGAEAPPQDEIDIDEETAQARKQHSAREQFVLSHNGAQPRRISRLRLADTTRKARARW